MKTSNLKFHVEAIDVIMLFLAIHLFSINVRLFYHINPDAILVTKEVSGEAEEYLKQFSWINFVDQNFISSVIFAVPYSILTVMVIKILKLNTRFKIVQFLPLLYVAVLDGVGTKLYYMVKYGDKDWQKFFEMGSWFYAIYTFTIIAIIGVQKVWGVKKDSEITISTNFNLDPEEILRRAESEISNEIADRMKIVIDNKPMDNKPTQKEIERILKGLDSNGLEENIIKLFESKKFLQKEIASILNTSERKVTHTLQEAGFKK